MYVTSLVEIGMDIYTLIKIQFISETSRRWWSGYYYSRGG